MPEWRWRLTALVIVGVIFLPFFLQIHLFPAPQRPIFLRYTSGHILVRVVDVTGAEALYRFSDGAKVLDVKNMTNKSSVIEPSIRDVLSKRLQNGDVVEFTGNTARIAKITMKNMAAPERMVLGIPLDPDTLSLEGWMSLPGVGRSLAEAIVADRQKNGEFGSFERISRVPGIGAGKIRSLQKYF